ncbi:undecaprenyl diphosphate synthase [Tissierella praeacuta DSM 18095]|uniref:Undecaprenyl diphosphate synthase n=1 Tax=Tissierella praeacuta DSM 18095 TaxID=1123404 RepID=A0A1M4V2L5_9FIRM|nr:undecaprenyl diphosphate synthase family protein [Tissierella praeacuta]TCU74041.1 undecaprenyl diphosphate synthase [Tissierella praeacuta]SHE63113.1 undecaprenyl diphosphate synthase [Tissierella praeacuta DSM 18095]SUP02826.1 Undecaprenyl pyrophosphate synthase [Tissierella praeacuta]
MRIPNHIGIIPDGNRRWAVEQGMSKEKGYDKGLSPGVELFKLCEKIGIKEITYYGFTVDNTKRPRFQRLAFTKACIDAVNILSKENADLLVLGNTESDMFPKALLPFTIKRQRFGTGGIKVNFLVNYGWQWDLKNYLSENNGKIDLLSNIKSKDISRVDLIIRWGGRRRLSGFLPLQSVYSDFYIIDEFWPDFKPEHFYSALDWYNGQDITLGG